jgi:hypothetical protein
MAKPVALRHYQPMRARLVAYTILSVAAFGCAPQRATVADIARYTSLRLCNGTIVHDLTSPGERDTTPGFSFHVEVVLPPTCTADFERQIAMLGGDACSAWPQRTECFVEDASTRGATKKHSTIMAKALGGAHYDLRFYE